MATKDTKGTDWFHHSDNVLEFARILHAAHYFATDVDPVQLCLDYFEKPWKWTAERDAWIAAGRPVDNALEDAVENGLFEDAEDRTG